MCYFLVPTGKPISIQYCGNGTDVLANDYGSEGSMRLTDRVHASLAGGTTARTFLPACGA
jgi:hypothetical protein